MTDEKICPHCGQPLNKHQWKNRPDTNEKFPICLNGKQRSIRNEPDRESLTPYSDIVEFIERVNRLSKDLHISTMKAERIIRLFDLLQRFTQNPDLKESLALIGGFALNFGLLSKSIPRLSYDLNFNFRETHTLSATEVTKAQKSIQEQVRQMLSSLGYRKSQFSHKAWWELDRFEISYRTLEGVDDNIKIDVCYSRRLPILHTDIRLSILHLKGNTIDVKAPKPEELCAEKIGAFLRRQLARDFLDIFYIAQEIEANKLDLGRLRKCALICTLYQNIDPTKVDFNELQPTASSIQFLEDYLREDEKHLVQNLPMIYETVRRIMKKIYCDLSPHESLFLREFYEKGNFQPELLDREKEFHPRLTTQSEIQWVLEKRQE